MNQQPGQPVQQQARPAQPNQPVQQQGRSIEPPNSSVRKPVMPNRPVQPRPKIMPAEQPAQPNEINNQKPPEKKTPDPVPVQ